jgi:hypothetical protein
VIADPPLSVGGVKVIVAERFPAVVEVMVGRLGTVEGIVLLLANDIGPDPIAFTAYILNVYSVPFNKPFTVMGDV